MSITAVNKLVIIGVGLIGGSFALALRKAGLVKHITGVGRSKENMRHALHQGVIDEIANTPASAMKDANIVLLAMPVGQTADIMAEIAPYLEAETIITDAGSTKQNVIIAARVHLDGNIENFVPGHPIAGAEQSGVKAAQADLFRNKHLILTPLTETRGEAVERITSLWQACGAQVSQMQANVHDEILAATSHLPHILAFVLMNHLGAFTQNNPDSLFRFIGSGFRDFTRIASSSPEMWRDICIANREALLVQIKGYQNELSTLYEILVNNDMEGLEKAFAKAGALRKSWLKDKM